MKRKGEGDYADMAEKRGWTWAGGELPRNVLEKTLWKCHKCGCTFEMRYGHAYEGRLCPGCSKRSRWKLDNYVEVGERLGLRLASEQPRNIREPATWIDGPGAVVGARLRNLLTRLERAGNAPEKIHS